MAQAQDVELLMSALQRMGGTAKFAEVFADPELEQQLESLLGTLKAARKQGLITFEGEMLLQGRDDDALITVVGAGDTAEEGEPPEPGSPDEEVHFSDGTSQQSVKSKAAFAALEASGAVNGETLVWMEGWDEWTLLSKCRERLKLDAAQAEPTPEPEAETVAAHAPAPPAAPAGEAAIGSKMQVQWNGKGGFQRVYLEMTETTITVLKKKGGKEICNASTAGATVALPKNERKGHPHSFRVDLKGKDSGNTKYICSVEDSGIVSQWMQAFMYGVQDNPLAARAGALHRIALPNLLLIKRCSIVFPILTPGS